jgi:hypothetical protein
MSARRWGFSSIAFLLVLILSASAVLFAPEAAAQTISGVIAGVVRDPQGAAVPGASVSVTNPATGRSYNTSADSNGYFAIREIPPGSYTVEVKSGGFNTFKRENVIISVNRTSIEDFSLSLAAEKVEIVVQAPQSSPLDTTGPTLITSLAEQQVRELPLLTRDINNLALLAPGVVSVRSFSFSSTLVPFSANGSRGRDNNFIIDSVDNNEPLFGGAATQFTNTDIFAEYTILTNQMKAEFGRNSGATINMITKSGSNNFNGSLFWFGQHDMFNSISRVEEAALLSDPATYYENMIGATLGGPVKKDKAFFFLSYQNDTAVNNLSDVYPVVSTFPTPAGLTALRSVPQTPALLALQQIPSVRDVPQIVANCFSSLPPAPATGYNLLNPCRNAVSVPVGTTSVPFATYLARDANSVNVHDHQLSGRFDYIIGRSDDVYFRYLMDDLSTPRVPLAPAGDAAFGDLGLYPDWKQITRQRTQSFLANHRHAWVDKLNEFRFSYSRISQGIGPFQMPESVISRNASATILDDFGGFGIFQPNFFAAGRRFTIGRDSSPSQTDSNSFQWQDNFSLIKGRHSIKFGVNFVRIQSDIQNIPGDLGLYGFESTVSGVTTVSGFQNFAAEPASGNTRAVVAIQRMANLQSDPNTGNITGQGSPLLTLREFDQFYFFQDDWRINPSFTVSYGIRYENFGQPINRVRELNSRGPSVARDDNNFAPRFGFAWAPFAKTVFRGGYAMMYNPVILNIPLLIWQSGPISPQFTAFDFDGFSTPASGFRSQLVPSGTFPEQPLSVARLNAARVQGCSTALSQQNLGTVPLLNCASQDTVDPNLVNPYFHQFSLGVQQQVARNLVLEIGYVGTKGTKLFQRVDENWFNGWDVNTTQALCAAGGFASDLRCILPRRNNTRGAITRITNGGSSIYHSLQSSLTRRFSPIGNYGNLGFTIAYTWSHNIDNASEIFGPGVRFLSAGVGTFPSLSNLVFRPQIQGFDTVEAITPLGQDPTNLKPERGNSAFDRRHRFVTSYLWSIRPDDRGFFTGGWSFSGIVTFQSGQAFNPLNASPFSACADYNGDGRLTNDRPAIGDPNAPDFRVALINTSVNPSCSRNGILSYLDLSGNPIDPSTAKYVQVPLGVAPYQDFTVAGTRFFAGTAGRNIIEGPRFVNWDVSLLKDFRFGERAKVQFRWEVYNVLNRRNPGNAIGNAYATDAQPSPGFAFSPRFTPAGVTGIIPENALDATDLVTGERTFLSREFMNTSTRRMQFGLKLIW